MKTLFGLIIFSVVIVSISGINHAYGLEYTKESSPSFKIEYPDGWEMYDEFSPQPVVQNIVAFYDNQEEWHSTIEIRTTGEYNNKQSELERAFPTGLYMEIQVDCEVDSIDSSCSDQELFHSQTVFVDGIKSHQLIYTWTVNYKDYDSVDRIAIVTYVPNGLDTWIIYSESTSYGYSLYQEEIFPSINSFDLFPIEIESQCSADHVSMIKNNGHRFCVFPTSFYSLLDRGWASRHNNDTGEMSLMVAEQFVVSNYEDLISNSITLEITRVAESYPEQYSIFANYLTNPEEDWVYPYNNAMDLVVSNGIVINSKDT